MLLVLPVQLQTLHAISYAAGLSTLAMVAATVLALASLLTTGGAAGHSHSHSLWPPALGKPGGPDAADALEWAGAICAYVFAFQGQTVFLEIMREMRQPGRFGAAVDAANLLMSAVYVSTVGVGYGARGAGVAPYLPDSMHHGPSKAAVGLLLAAHTGVCYVITGQPLHRALHAALFPDDAAIL